MEVVDLLSESEDECVVVEDDQLERGAINSLVPCQLCLKCSGDKVSCCSCSLVVHYKCYTGKHKMDLSSGPGTWKCRVCDSSKKMCMACDEQNGVERGEGVVVCDGCFRMRPCLVCMMPSCLCIKGGNEKHLCESLPNFSKVSQLDGPIDYKQQLVDIVSSSRSINEPLEKRKSQLLRHTPVYSKKGGRKKKKTKSQKNSQNSITPVNSKKQKARPVLCVKKHNRSRGFDMLRAALPGSQLTEAKLKEIERARLKLAEQPKGYVLASQRKWKKPARLSVEPALDRYGDDEGFEDDCPLGSSSSVWESRGMVGGFN
mmetsp:Transcript_30834/g.49445  ORF Transcript_30834/g.49445 Transcript_30834/m.49445 type:complete len:315 (+) Transcript_30834:162-1106(+)